MKETVKAAILFRPHVVVTIDSKGFSFRFLKQLRARCTREDDSPVHIHYVAPSFWAWKGGETRLGMLQKFIDHILCILPFEEEICRSAGLSATYVGHPLLEDALHLYPEWFPLSNEWKFLGNGDAFLRKHGLPAGAAIITLLPGSRLQEVTRLLPIFLQTLEQLKDSFPELLAVIPVAPNYHVKAYIEKEIASWSLSVILISGTSIEQKYDALRASRAALCTSGSAVMELQLAALPCVVAYRAHILTEWLIQRRTKLKFISLPNILLDTAIIPEKLFQECTSENIAASLRDILLDDKARQQQIAAAGKLFTLLQLQPRVLTGVSASPRDSCWPSMIAASTILSEAKTAKTGMR